MDNFIDATVPNAGGIPENLASALADEGDPMKMDLMAVIGT
jgi:hypothetical protein